MKKALFLTSTCLLLGGGTGLEAKEPVALESNIILASEATTESTPPTPSVSEPLKIKTVNEGVEIDLIDRGAKPRQKLRFSPVVGQKQQVKTLTNMNMAVRVNGQELLPDIALPTISLTGESELTRVDEDGTSYLTYTYGKPEVITSETDDTGFGAAIIPSIEEQFQQFGDVQMTFVYDRQGQVKETEIELQGERSPEFDQLIKQFSNATSQSSGVLPKKAVGVGAMWSTPQKIAIQGVELKQILTYELLEIDGENITLGMNFELAEETDSFSELLKLFPTPQALEGLDIDAKLVNMNGSGTMTMNLAQYFATNMEMTTDITMQMRVSLPQRDDLVMEMDMTSKVTVLPDA